LYNKSTIKNKIEENMKQKELKNLAKKIAKLELTM
jgi:hypothetical protein